MGAKTQKLIAQPLGELTIMKEVGQAADVRKKVDGLCEVLKAREIATKATEQSLTQRVEVVAR